MNEDSDLTLALKMEEEAESYRRKAAFKTMTGQGDISPHTLSTLLVLDFSPVRPVSHF